MEGQMQVFGYDQHEVRTVIGEDGEPWFVAADVCAVLEIGNVSQTASYLDEDEKGIITSDTPGGPQEMLIVTESGLYSLILRSRKPEAKAFKLRDFIRSVRDTPEFRAERARAEKDLKRWKGAAA